MVTAADTTKNIIESDLITRAIQADDNLDL